MGDPNMGIFKRETTVVEQVETGVEASVPEIVRGDMAEPRRQENDGTPVTDSISSLLQRVSASSVREIDGLIGDLKILRERMHDDGRRVHREIIEFASFSEATMQSTKVIAESLSRWKRAPGAPKVDEGA
jgi:hypothetical protein